MILLIVLLWFVTGLIAWLAAIWVEDRNQGQNLEVRWGDLDALVPCIIFGPIILFATICMALGRIIDKKREKTLFVLKGRSKDK